MLGVRGGGGGPQSQRPRQAGPKCERGLSALGGPGLGKKKARVRAGRGPLSTPDSKERRRRPGGDARHGPVPNGSRSAPPRAQSAPQASLVRRLRGSAACCPGRPEGSRGAGPARFPRLAPEGAVRTSLPAECAQDDHAHRNVCSAPLQANRGACEPAHLQTDTPREHSPEKPAQTSGPPTGRGLHTARTHAQPLTRPHTSTRAAVIAPVNVRWAGTVTSV